MFIVILNFIPLLVVTANAKHLSSISTLVVSNPPSLLIKKKCQSRINTSSVVLSRHNHLSSSPPNNLLILRGGSGYRDDDYGSSSRYSRHHDNYPPEQQQNYNDDYYSHRRSNSRYDYDDRSQRRDDYYGDEEQDDDDRDYYYEERPQPKKSSTLKLPAFKANRKLGTSFLFAGCAITLLGMSLFFNKTLLRIGNLLVILGVPLTIGPTRTMGYFFQPKKARATGCLLCGIFLVLVLGRPVLGIAMEIFGLLNLFGNMFPVFLVMLRQIPFIGDLIPDGSPRKKKKETRDYDRYEDYNNRDDRYEDERYY